MNTTVKEELKIFNDLITGLKSGKIDQEGLNNFSDWLREHVDTELKLKSLKEEITAAEKKG